MLLSLSLIAFIAFLYQPTNCTTIVYHSARVWTPVVKTTKPITPTPTFIAEE
jgi:hypothetical protein